MRTKLLVALTAVMALVATSASAGHDLKLSFDLVDNSAGANSDIAWDIDFDTKHPDSSTLHLPPGFLVAHADDNTSPLQPPPDDGEEVADADITTEWKSLLCDESTRHFDGHWVDPIDGGGDAVAKIELTNLATTIDVWVLHKSNGDSQLADAHYDLYFPDFGDPACDGSDFTLSFTLYGTTADGDKVVQNPCSDGTYTMYFEYTDVNGGSHSDSDTVDIVGNC